MMANESITKFLTKAIAVPSQQGWDGIFTAENGKLGLASWFVTWWAFVHIVKALGSTVLYVFLEEFHIIADKPADYESIGNSPQISPRKGSDLRLPARS